MFLGDYHPFVQIDTARLRLTPRHYAYLRISEGCDRERGDGRYCREYTATAVVGGKTQNTYGTACRQPDGAWQLVS